MKMALPTSFGDAYVHMDSHLDHSFIDPFNQVNLNDTKCDDSSLEAFLASLEYIESPSHNNDAQVATGEFTSLAPKTTFLLQRL